MNISERLKILHQSRKTVFTLGDLKSLWQESGLNTKIIAKRMVEKGLILKLAKGYYALSEEYNIYELANLIISPSYVSFNSALFYWNVCFQVSDTVSSVALINYKKEIEDKIYKYYAMKEKLFYNPKGIVWRENISVASPERAILDSCYFGLLFNVDREEKINFTTLREISLFYPKSVQRKLRKIYGSKI
jgi:predicted transcriptional regulator of viral defense system